MDRSYFFEFLDTDVKSNPIVQIMVEDLERFSDQEKKQVYVISSPVGERKYKYSYREAIIILIPNIKLLVVNVGTNNDLFEESSISIEPYSFSYISDNIEYDLDYDFENNEYIILDQKNIWNVKDYNLKFKTNLTIDNPQVLFGKNGIVPHNASINIALQWMSKPSQKRDTRKIGAFSIKDTFVNKTISMDIKPDRLKEYVKIMIVLYLI